MSIIRLNTLPLLPVLLTAATHAAEITIEHKPLTIEQSFTATALPSAGCVLLQIDADVWPEYEIIEIAPHAAKVAKGDVLVRFDPEDIDQKLADARQAIAAGALSLAQAELELQHLEQTTPHKLEAFRHAAEIAKEELAYFTQTRRKATEQASAQELERKKQMLSNQQEELKQLAKMYAADDLTEDTEEIILTRQKDDVAAAEFALRMETLDYQRTLDVTLPREAIALANNQRDTAIELRKAEAEYPRAIALKKIELETLKTTRQREQQTLAKLEHDRTQFEMKAPADGWFHYGPIENGRWTPGEPAKTLFPHGRPSPNRPFATFVPANAGFTLTAFLEESIARSLTTGLSGTATITGREDKEIPVKLTAIAAAPGPDGSYRADLTADWPKDLTPLTGATAEVRLIAYHQPAAILIPTNALAYDTKGWSVEVKLADGKTERRPVKRGRVSGDNTEILSGLEVGQVIISPDK